MFMMMFAMSFVAAASVNDEISKPDWLLGAVNFFNLGTTWADVIVAVAVLVMIFAAAYDILAFTAFESKWVKYSIAAGIALVSAVVGVINAVSTFMMGLAGGSVVFATFIAIGFAIVFFVIGTFWKGKMKSLKYKQKAKAAEGALELSAVATAAKVKEAKAALKAAEEEK
jgi:hypothetical protein